MNKLDETMIRKTLEIFAARKNKNQNGYVHSHFIGWHGNLCNNVSIDLNKIFQFSDTFSCLGRL